MSRKALIIIHLFFWVTHISSEFFLFQKPHMTPEEVSNFWVFNNLTWVTFITYFYVNYSIQMPYLLFKRKVGWYIFSIITTTAIAFFVLGDLWDAGFDFNFFGFPFEYTPLILFGVGMHYFVSTGIKMFDYFFTSQKTKRALKQEITTTELAYLKSQMSPHFLFNTLNNIYSLALDKSEHTASAIKKLTSLMTYIEDFDKDQQIQISTEVEYLKSYVALNQLRYDCAVNFNIIILSKIMIEPLILLPFIENAFKHGDTLKNKSIDILLKIDKEQNLTFHCKNSLSIEKRKDDVGGIGIKNIERRLSLLYNTNFNLKATIIDAFFCVQLNINSLEKAN